MKLLVKLTLNCKKWSNAKYEKYFQEFIFAKLEGLLQTKALENELLHKYVYGKQSSTTFYEYLCWIP